MTFLSNKHLTTVLTTLLPSLLCAVSSLGATANVTVVNDSFSPSTTSINTGDQVIWTWGAGSSSHNVVSTSASFAWLFPSPGGGPGTTSNQNDSNLRNSPFTFTNTFASAGSFPYECTEHAAENMKGTINVAAAPNVPPNVSITSPASTQLFIAPANVSIQASATDPNSGGSVTNVQFLVNSTVLANQTSAPFSTLTNNLSGGAYILTAIATDNFGLKATNAVNIVVDVPPMVTLTNPLSGSVFSAPANVSLQASAADSDGTVTNVQFRVGPTVLANKTSPPFSVVASNLAMGSYTLSAIVSDNNGATATNSVAINVITPSPLVINLLQSSPGGFQFSYAADVGLTYIVQRSTNLTASNWISISTNLATGDPVVFVDSQATKNPAFYRVGRLPNP